MSARILYFDCFSGIAGDMTLGALIDLGVDADALREALSTLPLEDWTLDVSETRKQGLRAVDVHVTVRGQREGHEHADTRDERHAPHYHYREIVDAIEGGQLPPDVVAMARAAFDAVADAEAHVHGLSREHVHFHEVGAVDSIVDIVGSAWGIWRLGVDRVESAPPPLGRGFIRCAHGRMPAPAPATLEILRGVPVVPASLDRELVTPTGAAFVRAWAKRVGDFPAMTVEGTGWGAGDADLPDRPNLLRLVLGRTGPDEASCTVIEANIDDLNPEIAAYVLERLFEAGARDAWFTPLYAKKGRPAFMIGALADEGRAAALEAILLAESSSIGLRRYPVTRLREERRFDTVSTPWGDVPVKIAMSGDTVANVAPEFETCAALARARGIPLKSIYQHAIASWMARN